MQKIEPSEFNALPFNSTSWDYSKGGFYLIRNSNTNKCYVGKSKNLFNRLRSHLTNARANKGIFIDKSMHGYLNDFEFYIISWYVDIGINFFTRKLELPMEQYYIKEFKSNFPSGYNIKNYESISIKPEFLGLFV